MKAIHSISFILVIIGGLNWLLIGLFNWGIDSILGGPDSWITKIVYILVGISAVYLVVTHKASCKHCETPSATPAV